MTGRAIEHLDLALGEHVGYVDFVSGLPEQPRLEIAPLDVGPALRDGVWTKRTAILTSATIPSSLATPGRAARRPDRRRRRRQPVRLRRAGVAVLRACTSPIRATSGTGTPSTTS